MDGKAKLLLEADHRIVKTKVAGVLCDGEGSSRPKRNVRLD